MAFTNTNKSIGTSSTEILAQNNSRFFLSIVNDSNEDIYLGVEAAAVMNKGILLKASGGSFSTSERFVPKGPINGISLSGTKNVTVLEGSN